MPNHVRITSGEHEGREGLPHERNKAGRYSVQFDDGEVIWFDGDQIQTLHCMLLNCRTYSGSPGHEYCMRCHARRSTRPEPPKPKHSKTLAELDKISKVLDRMVHGEIPITRSAAQRIFQRYKDTVPEYFRDTADNIRTMKTMEEIIRLAPKDSDAT